MAPGRRATTATGKSAGTRRAISAVACPPLNHRPAGVQDVQRFGQLCARNGARQPGGLERLELESARSIEAYEGAGSGRANPAVTVVQHGQRCCGVQTRYHRVLTMNASEAAVKDAEPLDHVEMIRRRFAEAWGQMGASWGIAPSTAAVQGYLLAHGGPVTDAELQQALGLSHRAIRLALQSCIDWGIVERAEEPRRSGRRGPAGRAWVALDDHWEWFRRVIEGRKEREGDPVIAILEQCLVQVRDLRENEDAERLEQRLEALLGFVREFDHALSGVLRADTQSLRNLFTVLDSLEDDDLDRLFGTLATVPPDELTRAAKQMSGMSPSALRRLLQLAGNPAVGRLLKR